MSGAPISLYDRMCWPEGELEQALAGGAHRRELIAYFGERDYRQLSALARQGVNAARRAGRAARALGAAPSASRRSRSRLLAAHRPRPKVYLLPGLMGSQLGWPRSGSQPPDLLWLDPLDIIAGQLTRLRWQRRAHPPLSPLGVIPHTYLALKLRLAARGFEVVLYDYDWRADVARLADKLVRRLAADPAEELVLLGHSMGGLLARSALAHRAVPAGRITRVIGLGAPHGGSLGAVQALQATYPVILRLAALDRQHDARELTTGVFRSFASLYQMLPPKHGTLDLLDPAAWPSRPDARLLAAARRFRAGLADPDGRFVSIVGVGQRTVTDLRREPRQFRYEISDAGDGTVAATCASLPGGRSYCLRCEHSELPRSARVAAAVIELSLTGTTRKLREGVSTRKGDCVQVTDAMLRREFDRKLAWEKLSAAARRRYLSRLNAPPALYRAGAVRGAR